MNADLLDIADIQAAFSTDRLHPNYASVAHAACDAHRNGRSIESISQRAVVLARLYSTAFRRHTIGAFHATGTALREPGAVPATPERRSAEDALADLANAAMQPVPRDFRAVLATFYGYDQGVRRTLAALAAVAAQAPDSVAPLIAQRFARAMSDIAAENGVDITADSTAPPQGCFQVPNLGITIVPLAYGDSHSWNLAYLSGEHLDVPPHAHRHGVEIHLGFNPTHGETILADHYAPVDEGYAMPIPPGTPHGWRNTTGEEHHVPFVFGSLTTGGWGLFFDVLPANAEEVGSKRTVRDSQPFDTMPYLERRIDEAMTASSGLRQILIPAAVTASGPSGGLELGVSRFDENGADYALDEHRLVSVVRGAGVVEIEGIAQTIAAHDHFGVPAGLRARIRQMGPRPLVALDCVLRAA